MSNRIVITGAPLVADSPGTLPVAQPRLDIRDFVNHEMYFSLYVRALRRMYETDQARDASHYGLGGIHGLPVKVWGGSGEGSATNKTGYCTHRTVLFPTWHRPYVAAYEQFVQQTALAIAQEDGDETWIAAARKLRVPYWDWASEAIPPDEIIAKPTVPISTPKGPETVENPFWGYKFNPIDPNFPARFANWPKTLRRPATDAPNAEDDPVAVKRLLGTNAFSITKNTYRLFSVTNWNGFSNALNTEGSTNSIEAIHDDIHGRVGGRGHMGNTGFAGHDPIFYLHHCNVDRLLAMWQAVHPNVAVSSGSSVNGTFTVPPNTTIGVNTDLTPFWNSQTGFWNSTLSTTGVRDFTKLGYTYPEFAGLNLNDTAAVQRAILAKVEQLYAPRPRSGGATMRMMRAPAPSSLAAETNDAEMAEPAPPSEEAPQEVLSATSNVGREGSGSVGIESLNYPREFTVRIICNQFELKESFAIHLFLGDAPDEEDLTKWDDAPNLLGSEVFFVNTAAESCENCQTQIQEGARTEAFIHLSDSLLDLDDSPNPSDEIEQVISYLQEKKISVRIVKVDGTIVDPSEFKSLGVEVISTGLSEPQHGWEKIPRIGESQHHYAIYTPQEESA